MRFRVSHIIYWARQNRFTLGMIAFTVLFYAWFMASQPSQDEQPKLRETKAQKRQTAASDVKLREETFKKNLMNRPDLTRAVGLSFMAVLFLGLVLDGYFLTSFYQGRPLIRETLLHARPRWGLSDALQVIVFLFFAEACIASAEIVLGLFFNLKKTGHDFFLLLNSLLRDLAAAAFIFYLVKKKFKTGLSQIGLSFESFFVNVKRGLTGYAAMLPPLIALLFILAFLAKIFSYEPMPQEVVQVYLRKSTDNYILPLSLFVTVLGPVIEEIFFRGFTYKAFRKQFGVLWAAIATAAVFAAFHMNLMAFLPIFFLGLFFAYLYEKTGSLVPSITAHVTHNLLMVFLTLGFKSLSG